MNTRMTIQISGRPRPFVACLLAAWVALPVAAHEGHDHGAPVPVDASWAPRASARSDDFELVAVLAGSQLVVWLDRAADNAPVAGARIEIEAGPWKGLAQPAADGSYRVDAAPLATPGSHALVIGVEAGDVVDLLPASLVVPAPVAAPTTVMPVGRLVAGGGGLAALLAAGWWWTRSRATRRAAR